mgnify:CR=1 FL=1
MSTSSLTTPVHRSCIFRFRVLVFPIFLDSKVFGYSTSRLSVSHLLTSSSLHPLLSSVFLYLIFRSSPGLSAGDAGLGSPGDSRSRMNFSLFACHRFQSSGFFTDEVSAPLVQPSSFTRAWDRHRNVLRRS